MSDQRFELDHRLAGDTLPIADLGLCDWRLMCDRRWPWTILIPKRCGIEEIFDLTPLDQTLLTFETVTVAAAMKSALAADKMNVGTLGNVVSMFHMHVVARTSGDANWPGPVWGYGRADGYADGEAEALSLRLREAVLAS